MDPCRGLTFIGTLRLCTFPIVSFFSRKTHIMATMFNSIRASRELETAGAGKALADAIASMMGDSMATSREDLVTKDFLKVEMAELRTEFRTENEKLRTEITKANNDTVRWLIGSQVVLIAALGTLMGVMRAFT